MKRHEQDFFAALCTGLFGGKALASFLLLISWRQGRRMGTMRGRKVDNQAPNLWFLYHLPASVEGGGNQKRVSVLFQPSRMNREDCEENADLLTRHFFSVSHPQKHQRFWLPGRKMLENLVLHTTNFRFVKEERTLTIFTTTSFYRKCKKTYLPPQNGFKSRKTLKKERFFNTACCFEIILKCNFVGTAKALVARKGLLRACANNCWNTKKFPFLLFVNGEFSVATHFLAASTISALSADL